MLAAVLHEVIGAMCGSTYVIEYVLNIAPEALCENEGALLFQVRGDLIPERIGAWVCFADKCVERGSERGFVGGRELLEWSWRQHHDMLLEGNKAIGIMDGTDDVDSQPNVSNDGIRCIVDDRAKADVVEAM